MKKQSLIDPETMANAMASVSKVDTVKTAAYKTAAVGAVALALPVLQVLFPQYVPVIKLVAGVLSMFGFGA